MTLTLYFHSEGSKHFSLHSFYAREIIQGMAFMKKFCQSWKLNTRSDLDLYSVLESVNWIWRGTGCLIVIPKGPIGRRKYVTEKLLILYDIFIFLVFASSFCEQFFDEYIMTINEDLASNVRVQQFVRQSINWMNLFNVISWRILTNNEFIETIHSLAKQDMILRGIGCNWNYASNCRKITIFARTYFVTFLIFTFHEFLNYGVNFSMFLDWITWWFPLIVHKTHICLFLGLIWMIGVRFSALNKKIEFIVRSYVPNSPLQMSSSEYKRIIRTVGNVHAQLYKIEQSISNIFLITLLTSALEAFVFVTVIIFSLIMDIQENQDYTQFVSDSFLLIMCGSPIITIVSICNWTRNQALSAVNLMNKIHVQDNDALSELIQIFSLQMLHQKSSFSVGGLFILGPPFLQEMTAAVTTYLVILIQFGEMEKLFTHKS